MVGTAPTRKSSERTNAFGLAVLRNGETMGKPSVKFWSTKPTKMTSAKLERPIAQAAPNTSPSVRFWNPIATATIRDTCIGSLDSLDFLLFCIP